MTQNLCGGEEDEPASDAERSMSDHRPARSREWVRRWCAYLTVVGSFLWLAGALASRPPNALDVAAALFFTVAALMTLWLARDPNARRHA